MGNYMPKRQAEEKFAESCEKSYGGDIRRKITILKSPS